MDRRFSVWIGVVTGVAMLALVLSGPARAQEAEGPVAAGKFLKLVSADNGVRRTVQQFAVIPGMTAEIRTAAARCITATFSAEVAAETGAMRFRALVNGELMQGQHPSLGYLVHWPAWNQFHLVSYTFWQCNLPRGDKTVTIEWQPSGSSPDTGVWVRGRTLIVEGK